MISGYFGCLLLEKLAYPNICLTTFSDFTDDVSVNQIHWAVC